MRASVSARSGQLTQQLDTPWLSSAKHSAIAASEPSMYGMWRSFSRSNADSAPTMTMKHEMLCTQPGVPLGIAATFWHSLGSSKIANRNGWRLHADGDRLADTNARSVMLRRH